MICGMRIGPRGMRFRIARLLPADIVRFLARPGWFGLHSCILAPRSRGNHEVSLRNKPRADAASRFPPGRIPKMQVISTKSGTDARITLNAHSPARVSQTISG